MRKKIFARRALFVIVVGFVAAALFGCGKKSKPPIQFVIIGTGQVSGVYYPTGGAITKLLNDRFDDYKIKATVEPTDDASVTNIKMASRAYHQFGFTQADTLHHAYTGTHEWENHPQRNLRAVFAIHPEIVTLVASEKSGIKKLDDIRGKRVRLANPSSDTLLTNAVEIMETAGLRPEDVKIVAAKAADCPEKLQNDALDAYFFSVGHPNTNILEVSSGARRVIIVPLVNDRTDSLLSARPYYGKSVIRREFYPNILNASDAASIGFKSVLIAPTETDETLVYRLTREVFENFTAFRQMHPALADLRKEDMLTGFTIPVHPGAMKYYREAGLDKHIDPKYIPPANGTP